MSEIEKMYEHCNFEKSMGVGSPLVLHPFTAEKQIEITKKLWELRPNVYPNFDLLVKYSYDEMIAAFVNNLWQDLTEEEKQQIKEILR